MMRAKMLTETRETIEKINHAVRPKPPEHLSLTQAAIKRRSRVFTVIA